MTTITVTLANGRQVPFDIDDNAQGELGFLLSVRKCGSTITNNICRALCDLNKRSYVDIGHTFFSNNVRATQWKADPALNAIIRPGNIYLGFRDSPVGLIGNPLFVEARKFIMIRDPRDALVSEYFSNAYSHPIPPTTSGFDDVSKHMLALRAKTLSTEIDDAVLRMVEPMCNSFLSFADVLKVPNTTVVKYEDVILDKSRLIEKLCIVFGLQSTPEATEAILKWADVRPTGEDNTAFVRQVTPGDHRRKLKPETIARLNSLLAAPLRLFDYHP